MADVRLTFGGEAQGAVDASKDVLEALDDLSRQALQTRAALEQALEGVSSTEAVHEMNQLESSMEDVSSQAVQTRGVLEAMFRGFDVNEADGKIKAVTAGLGALLGALTLSRSAIDDFKMPALWAGFGLGVEFVGALGAALVGLLGAIAPVTGALVAYPALLGAVGQGFITFKLAVHDVGEAIKAVKPEALAEAMAKLSPAAQEFVTTVRNDLIPRLDDLKAVLQENMFQGINAGLAAAATDANWALLEDVLGDTATAVGGVIQKFGELVGSPEFSADLRTIMEQNVVTIGRLGDGFLNLVPALTDVLVAAGPFIDWLTSGIVKLTDWVREAANAGRESGALAGFFDRTKESMELLWGVAKPLVQILIDLGIAAAPLGREILRDLADELDRIAAWTSSEGGQQTLRKYFMDAKPVIYETAGLVADLGEALGRISSFSEGDSTLQTFIQRLRTEVLPLFEATQENAQAAFGPAIADLVIELLRVFGNLSGPNGPLVVLVGVVADVAEAFADLLEHHPMIQELIFTLGGFLTWAKLIAATGLIGFLVSMAGAMLGLVAPTTAANLGFTALNATMRANPIGLIVTALQLLVAAVVVAYTQSETFRDIVDQTWVVIQRGIEIVKEIALRLWDFYQPIAELLIKISPFIILLRSLDDVVRALIGAFNDVSEVVRRVGEIFSDVLERIRSFRDTFAQAATNLGKAILNGIVAGITGIATEVAKFLNNVRDEIVDRVTVFRDRARTLGTAIFNGLVNALSGLVGRVRTIFTNVISAISGFAGRAATAARSVGTAIFNAVRNAISGIGTMIQTVLRGALNSALRVINAGIGRINTTLQFTVDIPDWLPGLPDEIRFNAPDIPYIPYLQAGGITTGPMLAMIGDNPGGREAVIPLPERGDLLGGGGNVTVHVQGSVISERQLIAVVRDGITAAKRRDPGYMGGGLAAVPR